eukprot:UN10399
MSCCLRITFLVTIVVDHYISQQLVVCVHHNFEPFMLYFFILFLILCEYRYLAQTQENTQMFLKLLPHVSRK